jgi:hypothetical protein
MAAGPIPLRSLMDLDLSRFGYGCTGNPSINFIDCDRTLDDPEVQAARQQNIARQSEAELRARALLVEVIGEPAVQTLESGGTYPVPSVRWPGTEYHIPKQGYIKIVKGGLWQEVCLVSSDHALPWADIVLSRIKMLEANETIVQGRGNRQGGSPNRTLEKLRETINQFVNPQRRR